MDWAKVGQIAQGAGQGYTRGMSAVGAGLGAIAGSLINKKKKKKTVSDPGYSNEDEDSPADDNGIKIWGEDEEGNW